MKKNVAIFASLAVVASLMTSCGHHLTKDQLETINDDLPYKVYVDNIEESIEPVADYLWEAVDSYTDQVKQETQDKIDDYNSTSALFGGSFFDVGALVGSSAPELYAKKYNQYIDYANKHQKDLIRDIKKIGEIVQNNPDLIDEFFSGDKTISLKEFSSIRGLPATISSEEIKRYEDLELTDGNQAQWGLAVMGTLKEPKYSPLAVLCAFMIEVGSLDYPEPVYAVYQDEIEYELDGKDYTSDGWEVGMDTEQAYYLVFDKHGLDYVFIPTEYSERYVNSKENKLK